MSFSTKLMYNPVNENIEWVAVENIAAFTNQGWFLGAPPSFLKEFDKISKTSRAEFHEPKKKFLQCGKWKLIDPKGKVYMIDNLLRFCRTRALPYARISANLDGWICQKVGRIP